MHRIIVAGTGPDVGKTVVSAILTTLFQGEYWKPIQCGEEESSDTAIMKRLIDSKKHRIHHPAYSLKTPVSPHHAARIENISINPYLIIPPETKRTLIIESVGGVLVPLSKAELTLDLFKLWNCRWIIVSRHYLGSINHTLLTIEVLKQRGIEVNGVIFNGEHNVDSEEAILKISHLPSLGRLLPEKQINAETIQRYAELWKPNFL